MATITQIRDALDAALIALGHRPVQEIDKAPNVTGSACAAMVAFGGANYLTVMGNQGDGLTFTVTMLAGPALDRASRQRLDDLVDPDDASTTSLRNGISGTLGGVVAWCNVATASEYRNYPTGSGDYIGCQFGLVIGT
jgi:hypothetical protein